MLTATYSIVALSTEQKKARDILRQLQKYIGDCLERQEEIDFGRIQSALDTLAQFDHYCHARKMETVLIPSVKGADRELDGLLTELESISLRAFDLLHAAQEQSKQALDQGIMKLSELRHLLEHYCDSLSKRFAKEDEELVPMLVRLLPIDQWFEIGAKFLSIDAQRKRRTTSRAPRLPALA